MVQADVCVIGAGAAGIYLAVQLCKLGRSVVLLEAGSSKCVDSSAIGFDAISEATHYAGATAGRFFGVGGSTSRWGGALAPHTVHDLRGSAAIVDAWPHIVRSVSDMAPAVLEQLGYRNGWDFESSADRFLGQVGFTLREIGINVQAGLYMPFRSKNFIGLLNLGSAGTVNPRVYVNAVAKSWRVDGDQIDTTKISSVTAISRNGNELVVNAGHFVVTAGSIESARILLEINESGALPVLRHTAATGCYLADHLSVPMADVEPASLNLAANLFAPRFSGNWMRGIRLLEGNPAKDAPRAFAHFIFSNVSPGFEIAKEVLCAIQGRRLPSITPAGVAAGLGDLVRLAYNRFMNTKLYIPAQTAAHLQLDVEQTAVRANQVSLSRQIDAYGRRIASIHWEVSDIDMTNISNTASRFLAKWPGVRGGLPKLQARKLGVDGTKPYDAYHPVGTCRMGEGSEAVVDLNLKVWGLQNLWVSSTAVLPSAGTANPTFTMLCLTHKLAELLRTMH